ncbi:MAG: hypothetical protein HeimC3_12520 [Candidatus Heimdallarchaeota archaeon LC_3]|nr:MAG: hypothetical protein HeimC3_12520 [Candidatus Heimdallarchaeota archaeon LC_3]
MSSQITSDKNRDKTKSEKIIDERIKDIHEDWLRRYNLSLIDQPITATIYFCIFKYQGEHGIIAKQIAKILNMKTTAIYHHIIKLEEANLIVSTEDPENSTRRRYFENRPDVLYELKEKNYQFCDTAFGNSSIKDLIKNKNDLEAFRQNWINHMQNRFKDGGTSRFNEIKDLRRSISVISASAMEADKNLTNISGKFQEILKEDPFVVTLLLPHDRYHKLMDKIKKEIIDFIVQRPECETKFSEDHKTNIKETDKKYPFTVSIMALPPLVAFREDIESIEKLD